MAGISKRNIEEFQLKLLRWYSSAGRRFPWRRKRLSRYKLIIAEALLQRTKAETVARFYHDFLHLFPTWSSIVNGNIRELEKALKPIGLYRQRAKRLKALAFEMMQRNGVVPSARADLESIPFFGQYMTNAVVLLIHRQPSPLIDVNMARVLERYFKPRTLTDIRYDPFLQKLAYSIVQHQESKELNWAVLDFAALICTARSPKCEICFLSQKCTFFNIIKRR